MGTEVTKNDLAAVNKRIDNADKAFNDLKKACDLGNGNACRIYDREHGRAGAAK